MQSRSIANKIIRLVVQSNTITGESFDPLPLVSLSCFNQPHSQRGGHIRNILPFRSGRELLHCEVSTLALVAAFGSLVSHINSTIILGKL